MSWKERVKSVVVSRGEVTQLRKDVDVLQESIEEYRRLNERLSDVLDIVEELLVPAVDRDEEKLRGAALREDLSRRPSKRSRRRRPCAGASSGRRHRKPRSRAPSP